MVDKQPYLTLDELASELGRSRTDIEKMVERRELPPPLERPGRPAVISRASMDAYLRRRRGASVPVVHLLLSDDDLQERFLEASGGLTPAEFFARFEMGAIADSPENMALLVQAVALGGDRP